MFRASQNPELWKKIFLNAFYQLKKFRIGIHIVVVGSAEIGVLVIECM